MLKEIIRFCKKKFGRSHSRHHSITKKIISGDDGMPAPSPKRLLLYLHHICQLGCAKAASLREYLDKQDSSREKKDNKMAANSLDSDWTTDVIGFLSQNLPIQNDGEGWDHMSSTAYQIGCEALVALGQAHETKWGAIPRKNPQLPNVLPRWNDVCVAILWLANQQNKLSYRLPDGSVPPSRTGWIVKGAPSPSSPNIAAAQGLGPAYAAPEVLSVLQALGLVAGGCWTKVAETVLWRCQPTAWGMDITSGPRFTDAAEQAFDTMPGSIRAEMDKLSTITEADVATAVAEIVANREEMRAKYGPEARVSPADTTEIARKSLEFMRRGSLDWLFFRHWRLADGWLVLTEEKRALKIFHDPLAISMCRAVIARLYPDFPFLADQEPLK